MEPAEQSSSGMQVIAAGVPVAVQKAVQVKLDNWKREIQPLVIAVRSAADPGSYADRSLQATPEARGVSETGRHSGVGSL